ncbi:potassium channel family protein [Thermophilibacter mediterraneus]|uniref:potassium channel family protein n=1 Tax=Thermophilibacter mediterraneus TaxID=1871031 RepID=UPI00235383CA|nr:NAD-binding protein [Thermophilibacter mediterraneus]
MDIIIVGGGKTGTYLATLLTEDGYRIRIIESRKDHVARLREQFGEKDVILGNGADPLALERAGILHADVVVAATGSDEVNLVVSTLAKMEYSVGRVVARVNNPANAWMFNEGMGVDVSINQAELLARSVQEGLDLRDVFTILRLGKDGHAVVRVEVRPGSRVIGEALRNMELPGTTILVAIERQDGIVVPKGDTRFEAGDKIIAFTDAEGRSRLHRAFA